MSRTAVFAEILKPKSDRCRETVRLLTEWASTAEIYGGMVNLLARKGDTLSGQTFERVLRSAVRAWNESERAGTALQMHREAHGCQCDR